MSVVFIILHVAILMAAAAVAAFLWSVNHGQFDDVDTPPYRAIVDDERHNRQPNRGDADGSIPPQSGEPSRGDSL